MRRREYNGYGEDLPDYKQHWWAARTGLAVSR